MAGFYKDISMKKRLFYLSFLSLFLFACSDPGKQATVDHGPKQVRDRIVTKQSPLAKNFHEQVKPILDKRCVVCHACYDAPCQLKLSSAEGIDRGFSPVDIYETRFKEVPPMRLFIDKQHTEQWRKEGYMGVLNEHDQNPRANLEQSVLFQLLALKESHPQPTSKILPKGEFDFSLTREQTCPDMTSIDKYKKQQPLAGMPYGLPNLDNHEFNTLKEWIEQGAPMAQSAPLDLAMINEVDQWETLFNQANNKSRLINRYIYEHLFLGHIYFSDQKTKKSALPVYFRLVRSSTPPGEAIQEIATRRPYDDPKVSRVFYRLRQVTSTIVTKTHMPYALNQKRLERWNELFYQAPFSVAFLPGYQNSSNPFKNFASIPADARYQFLLDEAEYTIMGFIKGPVCRGQTALNVIQDKFWVFFADPNNLHSESYANFVYQQADNLELPSDYSATHYASTSWKRYAKREKAYINAQKKALSQGEEIGRYIGLNSLWQGDNNASLTIFRHFDSAVVVRGLQGQAPKTAWVINYPVLERIHYLLVAGFDVYGSIRHQLVTRLYMDFLRLESEMSFITLLPKAQRKSEIESWYKNATEDLSEYIDDNGFFFNQKNSVTYHTNNEKQELFKQLRQHFQSDKQYDLNITSGALTGLNSLLNPAVQQLAQVSFIMVEDDKNSTKTQLFTLLRHNEHSNISTLLKEKKTRVPELDKAEVFKGLLSSYPQVIFKINKQQQQNFVTRLQQVNSPALYEQFLSDFAVRRTDPNFWKISDLLHQTQQQQQPINYGLFDYNRLENR